MSIVFLPFRLLVWIWNSSVVRFVLFALVILLLVADFYGVDVFTTTPADPRKFGPISAWFSSLITLIAITIAAESLRTTKLKNEQEKIEAEASKLDTERQKLDSDKQAHLEAISGVYCWLGADLDAVTKEPRSYQLEVQNNTNLPIYDWEVRVPSGGRIADSVSSGSLPPGVSVKNLGLNSELRGIELPNMPATEIEFKTPSGERLIRSFEGKVSQLER